MCKPGSYSGGGGAVVLDWMHGWWDCVRWSAGPPRWRVDWRQAASEFRGLPKKHTQEFGESDTCAIPPFAFAFVVNLWGVGFFNA